MESCKCQLKKGRDEEMHYLSTNLLMALALSLPIEHQNRAFFFALNIVTIDYEKSRNK